MSTPSRERTLAPERHAELKSALSDMESPLCDAQAYANALYRMTGPSESLFNEKDREGTHIVASALRGQLEEVGKLFYRAFDAAMGRAPADNRHQE